jgi:SAM-dependent methyltransferase
MNPVTHAEARLASFGVRPPPGVAVRPLWPARSGSFIKITPGPPEDYQDGIESLVSAFNQTPEPEIRAWLAGQSLDEDEIFRLHYNTSPDRANAYRLLPLLRTHKVLEVGAGCGPVSEFLWSRSRTLSVEASGSRCDAAGHRLVRLPSFGRSLLLCADFHSLAFDPEFDWVIFNGVLEYGSYYLGGGTDAFSKLLTKARAALRPGGRCVIAIENRLGLKYLAGAEEDHLGVSAAGLEGYADASRSSAKPAQIKTFTKYELTGLLRDAGFSSLEWLFPFPDYKFPRSSSRMKPSLGNLLPRTS